MANQNIEFSRLFKNSMKPSLSEMLVILVCSLGFASGRQYIQTGYLTDKVALLIYSVFYFVVFYCSSMFIQSFISRHVFDSKNYLRKLFELAPYKQLVVFTLIILTAWLPIILSLYPGTLSNDTTNQLCQYIAVFERDLPWHLQDHHPVFDTLVIGWVVCTSANTFRSLHWGIFTYCVLQAILTAITISACCMYIKSKLRASDISMLVIGLFVCLCPLFPVWSMNISKDALFSWLYIWFLMFFIEIVRTRCKVLEKRSFIVLFVVSCLLITLTKKTGVYIVAGSVFVLVAVFRKSAQTTIIAGVCSVLLIFVLLPVLFSFFNIEPGGKQEMFSVPFQQTARYVLLHDDEVTQEEKTAIDALLDYDTLADRYYFSTADTVKGYRERGGKQQYLSWARVWFIQGIKHPETYFDAAAGLNAPWLSFIPISSLFDSNWHIASSPEVIPDSVYEQNAQQRLLSQSIKDYYYSFVAVPGLGILMSEGLYAILLPALALILILKSKQSDQTVGLVPVFISILFLFLSPEASGTEAGRYILPMVYSAPLLFMYGISVFHFHQEAFSSLERK